MTKISFCTPLGSDNCKIYYAFSLARTDWDGLEVVFFQSMAMMVPNAMMQFVEASQKAKCDFMVVAASDVGWGGNYVKKLVAHNKPIIGGWANGRTSPFLCHVCDSANWDSGLFKPVTNPCEHKGIERVCSNGGEFMCYRMDTFDKIPSPWFFGPDMVLDRRLMTEDYFFARQAHKYGVEMWVDWECHLTHATSGLVTLNGNLIDQFPLVDRI